ncbi:MAG: hypothetical protein ACJ77Z_18530 [Thermoleophilaceae bacterium]
MKEYLVIHEHAEDGCWGSPDVEGVFALGHGQPLPEPHTDAGRVPA